MQLPAILSDGHQSEAAGLVSEYYTGVLNSGRVRTGARFDTWAGGGDAPEVMNRVTADDLLAASFLSVDFSHRAAIGILETRRTDIAALLSQIPADLDLADLGQDEFKSVLGEGSPAWELWDLLRGKSEGKPDEKWGIGPTKASKILARKRPRLIPIWDSIVSKVTGVDSSLTQWTDWHAQLTAEDKKLAKQLDDIQAQAHVPFAFSRLRTLDVVLWMHGKDTGLHESALGVEDEA